MKTYLITTHHNRLTRHDYIKAEMKRMDIDYTPILAPDWRIFQHTDLEPPQYKRMSLTMAYYQIAQTALFLQESNQFQIIEDDFHDLGTDHDGWESPKDDWDLLYLTTTEHNRQAGDVEPHNEKWNRIKGNWWETVATRWSLKFAQSFVDHIEQKISEGLWLGNIDHELIKMNATGLYNFYAFNKKISVGLSSEREYAEGKNITFEGSIVDDPKQKATVKTR